MFEYVLFEKKHYISCEVWLASYNTKHIYGMFVYLHTNVMNTKRKRKQAKRHCKDIRLIQEVNT